MPISQIACYYMDIDISIYGSPAAAQLIGEIEM